MGNMKRAFVFYAVALLFTYLVLFAEQHAMYACTTVNIYNYIVPAVLYSLVFAVALKERR